MGRRIRGASVPGTDIEVFITWKMKTARRVRATTGESPAHIARCAEAAAVIEAARDVDDILDSGTWLPFWVCCELGVEYRDSR